MKPIESTDSFYFCTLQSCSSIFPNKLSHSDHTLQLERLPSDLVDDYIFKRKLGSGTFGFVFEVFDKSDKNVKAIKIFRNQKNNVEDLFAELQVLTELYHQNIIRYFRSGICMKNNVFIVMEYCEMNLQDFIIKTRPLPIIIKNRFFRQICEGLDFLHNQNEMKKTIVHQDLKLTNILLKGDKIRITDFRKSKIVNKESITKTSSEIKENSKHLPSVISSLYEFRDEKMPSPSQDIWNLGIIAHQIYSNGNHPFNRPNSNLRRNLKERNYVIDPSISENSPVHQIIEGCFENDANKRLSIREILNILTSGNPITTFHSPSIQNQINESRKKIKEMKEELEALRNYSKQKISECEQEFYNLKIPVYQNSDKLFEFFNEEKEQLKEKEKRLDMQLKKLYEENAKLKELESQSCNKIQSLEIKLKRSNELNDQFGLRERKLVETIRNLEKQLEDSQPKGKEFEEEPESMTIPKEKNKESYSKTKEENKPDLEIKLKFIEFSPKNFKI